MRPVSLKFCAVVEMNNNPQGKVTAALAGLAGGLNPMKSITFLFALVLTALATWNWLNKSGEPRPSFPLYGTIAASYAGGFLIGRVFWKVVKTAAIIAAIVLGGLAVLNRAHVDTSKAREETEAGITWVRNEAKQAKHYLVHFLPSGGAGGVGVFAGGRRRRDDAGDEPNSKA
jgi:hypothetical protein